MSWTRNEVTLLLEEYRKWPNLYTVKSVNYKNRNLRRKALESIEQKLKKIKTYVTIADIQAKFQSLKQTAVKEYKKCRNSCKSGTSPDEIYEPSLWYFDMITFAFDSSIPRKSTDTLEIDGNTAEEELLEESPQDINYGDSQDSMVIYDKEDELAGEDESASEEVISVIVSKDGTVTQEEADRQTQPPPLVDNNVEPKKKKRKMKDDPYLEAVSNSLINLHKKLDIPSTPVPNKSQFESFGQYIAAKLEKIDVEEIRDEVEEEIISIINKGLKKCRNKEKIYE